MDKLVNRSWKIEWRNRDGIHAPALYVEAKKREEALKLAKFSSRLADFPEKWGFKLVSLPTREELIELGVIKPKKSK
jgi:hypothetical protein